MRTQVYNISEVNINFDVLFITCVLFYIKVNHWGSNRCFAKISRCGQEVEING